MRLIYAQHNSVRERKGNTMSGPNDQSYDEKEEKPEPPDTSSDTTAAEEQGNDGADTADTGGSNPGGDSN